MADVIPDAGDRIGATLDRFSGGRYHEALHVGVVGTFATGWLIPRLGDFADQQPPTHAQTASGSRPYASSTCWRASTPMIRWKSRTISGKG